MSGHSKWSTIRRKKNLLDNHRSKIFTKIVRVIYVAVKQNGPNIDTNPRLRLAIENAKRLNMPKKNIENAIDKARTSDVNYTSVTYEGVGIKGVTYIIECLTDNSNRTVGSVRCLLNKYGGKLVKSGSVSFDYEKKSFFELGADNNIVDIDDFVLNLMYESNLNDVCGFKQDGIYITGRDDNFGDLHNYLEKNNISIVESKICYFPSNVVVLNDEEKNDVIKLIDSLEELDDVNSVYTNVCL